MCLYHGLSQRKNTFTTSHNSCGEHIYVAAEDEEAFDVLYCIAFEMMDAQWLAMRASYMEFNVCMLSLTPRTRAQIYFLILELFFAPGGFTSDAGPIRKRIIFGRCSSNSGSPCVQPLIPVALLLDC